MASNFYWRIGDTTYSVPLSATKVTTPSLCVDDNGTIKYVSLAPGTGPANNFHVYYNGVQYYATTGVSPNNWTNATVQWAGTGSLTGVSPGMMASDGKGKVIMAGNECTHYLFPADYNAQTLVSTDGGVTWSHSQIGAGWTISNQGSLGFLCIATNKTGTWIIASYRADLGDYSGAGYSVSTNDAASWSQVALLPGFDSWSSTDFASIPKDMHYGNGTWIVGGITAAHKGFSGSGSTYWTIFYGQATIDISTNNGASWTTKVLWSFDPSLGSSSTTKAIGADTITTLATDNKGVWIAAGIHYTTITNSEVLYSRSTDNGVTWSTPAVLWGPRNSINPTTPKCIATNGSGTWVIGGVDYTSSTTDIGVIVYSTDNGVTWSVPIQAPSSTITAQLIYDQGQFLMAGRTSYMTSTDGITWSDVGTLPGWTVTNPDITGLVYSGSRFVIVGKDSGNAMIQTSS